MLNDLICVKLDLMVPLQLKTSLHIWKNGLETLGSNFQELKEIYFEWLGSLLIIFN